MHKCNFPSTLQKAAALRCGLAPGVLSLARALMLQDPIDSTDTDGWKYNLCWVQPGRWTHHIIFSIPAYPSLPRLFVLFLVSLGRLYFFSTTPNLFKDLVLQVFTIQPYFMLTTR